MFCSVGITGVPRYGALAYPDEVVLEDTPLFITLSSVEYELFWSNIEDVT